MPYYKQNAKLVKCSINFISNTIKVIKKIYPANHLVSHVVSVSVLVETTISVILPPQHELHSPLQLVFQPLVLRLLVDGPHVPSHSVRGQPSGTELVIISEHAVRSVVSAEAVLI